MSHLYQCGHLDLELVCSAVSQSEGEGGLVSGGGAQVHVSWREGQS